MTINEDTLVFKFPKLINNYDETHTWKSISWLGYQIEFFKKRR